MNNNVTQDTGQLTHLYEIYARDYSKEQPAGILHILNIETLEITKMPLSQLAKDIKMLAQFSPQDIFNVGLMFGQWLVWQEKKF